jgi:hypothetical protein
MNSQGKLLLSKLKREKDSGYRNSQHTPAGTSLGTSTRAGKPEL